MKRVWRAAVAITAVAAMTVTMCVPASAAGADISGQGSVQSVNDTEENMLMTLDSEQFEPADQADAGAMDPVSSDAISYDLESSYRTTNNSNNYSTYHDNWGYWSHGASRYSLIRTKGSLVISSAKALCEAGFYLGNPDDLYSWCKSNGAYGSDNISELTTMGNQIKKYASGHKGSASLSNVQYFTGNAATDNAKLMQYLKQGKYILVATSNSLLPTHVSYIAKDASIASGAPVISDTSSGYAYNTDLLRPFNTTDTYTGIKYTCYRVISITVPKRTSTSITVNHKGSSNVTETSFRLHAEVDNPVGFNTEKVGLYIGSDKNKMKRVVHDYPNASTFTYYCSNYHPGTKFYYRLFVISGGIEYCTSQTLSVTTSDTHKPTISDVKITNQDSTGYTISCVVEDNGVINRVMFPTWTQLNGQDDIAKDYLTSSATKGTLSNGRYTFRVKDSDHNYEKGYYITTIYAIDSAGNKTQFEKKVYTKNYFKPSATVVYGNNTYELYNDNVSWTDASSFAKKNGGHLVSITSSKEQTAVAGLITDKSARSAYWLGGYTVKTTSRSNKWVNGDAFSYSNFASGQPDGSNNYGLYMQRSGKKWADTAKSSVKFGFIVEYENRVDATKVTLSKSSLRLTAGKSATLTTTITPSNSTQKTVTWVSGNTKIATVTSKGVVKAVAYGTTTITAKVGKVSAKCTITVDPVIPQATTDFVKRMYTKVLKRTPSTAELRKLDNWSDCRQDYRSTGSTGLFVER